MARWKLTPPGSMTDPDGRPGPRRRGGERQELPKLTPTQRRIWDAMKRHRLSLFYWPGRPGPGHFILGKGWGDYSMDVMRELNAPRSIPISTVESMVKKGCFIVKQRINADACDSSRSAKWYRRNPEFQVIE